MVRKNQQILITGGAGFIGSLVNKLLADKGYQTIVMDNLSTGYREAVVRGTFYKADIGSREDLEKIFNNHRIDCVIHLAASIDVGESVRHPAKYYRNNVAGAVTLFNTMLDFKVKKLVFSSTAAVYGIPEKVPIKEDHSLNPINPYGKSKWMAEKILEDYDAAYGFKYCSLRYFNAAGGDPEGEIPNLNQSQHNLIPSILRSIRDGKPLEIFGTDYHTPDGTCIRDYIHLFDLGSAHILAMEKLLADEQSQIYNLGNGSGFTVKEVIHAAEKVTGAEIPCIETGRREGDPPILVADANKAASALGWKPQYTDLESMIRHAQQAMDRSVHGHLPKRTDSL